MAIWCNLAIVGSAEPVDDHKYSVGTSRNEFISFTCRVPFVDAKRYVAALRAREGSPATQTFIFNEDTHALDRPQTEFEQWINVAAFLKRHLH